MSECKLNHSQSDVQSKYESQAAFLPEEMKPLFERFFKKEHSQELLNEVFHLLKKYDLAPEDEKSERTNRLNRILKNI
jgi:hypothetical protein